MENQFKSFNIINERITAKTPKDLNDILEDKHPLFCGYKECIDNNAWHHISWDKITWVETFEKMGFKTYKVIDEIVDGKYLEHYLDDHEYTWFVMRFS
mgnify:CR=1 FL=1